MYRTMLSPELILSYLKDALSRFTLRISVTVRITSKDLKSLTRRTLRLMIFGQGPQNCIGMRYALLTIKMTIVYLLRKHRVVRSDKTTDVLVPDIKNFNVFKDGVFMKFEKRF